MDIFEAARPDESISLKSGLLDEMIAALGTPSYGTACFRTIEDTLDAEHWALFRRSNDHSIQCVADGSRSRSFVARENIARFVAGLHNVDPVLKVLKRARGDGAFLSKVQIQDLEDERHRECFELAHARERLSYVSLRGGDAYFLSVYRGARKSAYSGPEMRRFMLLANFIISTASKHQKLLSATKVTMSPLGSDRIEQALTLLSDQLSKREREVCLKAATGMTIESTAFELNVSPTSVITYRQRAYRKLGISRQGELMAMVANLCSQLLPPASSETIGSADPARASDNEARAALNK